MLRLLPRTDGRLSGDDAYVAKRVLAWSVVFCALAWVMHNVDAFRALYVWLRGSNRFGFIAGPSMVLFLFSVIYGVMVSMEKTGRGVFVASVLLAVINTVWIAFVLTQDIQGGTLLLVFAWLGTFLSIWMGFQVPEKHFTYALWAAPTLVAAWFFRNDSVFMIGIAVALMVMLSLVLVYGISMVEASSVSRGQKVVAMLLFVQSAALFLILAKTILEHGAASAGNLLKTGRDVANLPATVSVAAAEVEPEEDAVLDWVISVFGGSPWAALLYSATVHAVLLLSWHLNGLADAAMVVTFTLLWAVLMVSHLFDRPVAWGRFFMTAALHTVLTVFFMIPAALNVARHW